MRAIDADALYEKAASLEAQALDYVGKLIERDGDEVSTEWKIWTAILTERTAFKHDVFDAPTIEPESQWIPCSERLPKCGRQVLVYARSVHFVLAKYDEMRNANGIYEMKWVTFDAWKPFYTIKEVIAWMPLPTAYEENKNE